MMELLILGTSCMQPTKERNHVGILLSYKNEKILFDCGENIQRQLKIANKKASQITKIFISHWHGDHVLGLPGLMYSMGADQYEKELEIYGPKGTKKRIEHMLKAFESSTFIKHKIFEINNKSKMDFKEFYVESRKLKHGCECLGFSFIEKDRRRIKTKFVNKIPGILLGKLQQGKTITHENKKFTPKETTYLVEGKKITVIMDTRPCDNYIKLAQDSDLLISEATFLDENKENAEKYLHLTAKEAGMLANQANVKKLVLLHFSPRYKDIGEIRNEAKEVFGDVTCAEDFMKFKI